MNGQGSRKSVHILYVQTVYTYEYKFKEYPTAALVMKMAFRLGSIGPPQILTDARNIRLEQRPAGMKYNLQNGRKRQKENVQVVNRRSARRRSVLLQCYLVR
jgi:hypothetical protein